MLFLLKEELKFILDIMSGKQEPVDVSPVVQEVSDEITEETVDGGLSNNEEETTMQSTNNVINLDNARTPTLKEKRDLEKRQKMERKFRRKMKDKTRSYTLEEAIEKGVVKVKVNNEPYDPVKHKDIPIAEHIRNFPKSNTQ